MMVGIAKASEALEVAEMKSRLAKLIGFDMVYAWWSV
jgi:hypothetical protein